MENDPNHIEFIAQIAAGHSVGEEFSEAAVTPKSEPTLHIEESNDPRIIYSFTSPELERQ